MSNFKQKLKLARLPERSVLVCLRGDLAADFDAAERDLKRAQESRTDSLENSVSLIVERIDALRDEMREHSEEFRLRAMSGPAFHAFKAAYPPRNDDDGSVNAADAHLGVNIDTFFDALIRASVVSPTLDDEDWVALLDVLTDRQYNTLVDAAWLLNRGEVSVPFSQAALLARRNSAAE